MAKLTDAPTKPRPAQAAWVAHRDACAACLAGARCRTADALIRQADAEDWRTLRRPA